MTPLLFLLALKWLVPDDFGLMNEEKRQFLEQHPEQIQKKGEVTAAFTLVSPPADPKGSVFFVHGSPGDWGSFAGYTISEVRLDECLSQNASNARRGQGAMRAS